jgi:surfactin synthase thioesterase subunit
VTTFIRPRKVAEPVVRLVVFHHAGGSASAYHPLARALPEDWDVLLVDLPGRGRRHAEPPVRNMDRLLDKMARDVAHVVSGDTPYALFGHSMGAVVASEVGRRLADRYRPPAWVGVSGRPAPLTSAAKMERWSELSDAQLSTVLTRLGGTPERLREEPELYQWFLRIFRADLEALDSYSVDPGRTMLPCPLSAFGGLTDPSAPPASLPAWEHETTGRYRQCFLPGGHFYFFDAFAALAREIRHEVHSVLDRVRAG